MPSRRGLHRSHRGHDSGSPRRGPARAAGAEVLMRPEPGLNAALEDAAVRLAPAEGEALVVVLGDVAGALPEDFRRLVAAAGAGGPSGAGDPDGSSKAGVWLAPSADGGNLGPPAPARAGDSVLLRTGERSAPPRGRLRRRRRLSRARPRLPGDRPRSARGSGRLSRDLGRWCTDPRPAGAAAHDEPSGEKRPVTMRPSTLRLLPLHGLPEIRPGSDLAALIAGAARAEGVELANRIVVVCQKNRVEGRGAARRPRRRRALGPRAGDRRRARPRSAPGRGRAAREPADRAPRPRRAHHRDRPRLRLRERRRRPLERPRSRRRGPAARRPGRLRAAAQRRALEPRRPYARRHQRHLRPPLARGPRRRRPGLRGPRPDPRRPRHPSTAPAASCRSRSPRRPISSRPRPGS
jgi:hypothetical protein